MLEWIPTNAALRFVGLKQNCGNEIFSLQVYMDFALVDSVLHFNDGKRGYASILSQMRLDAYIHSHIYYWANDTRRISASAKKNTEK